MTKNKGMFPRGDSSMDKIRAFYIDPEKNELSPNLEEVRKRYVTAYNMILSYFTYQQIAKKWEQDYGLSQAQAYIDIRNSQILFGHINKMDREARKNILYQHSFALLRRAREQNDVKAEAKAIDLMGKYGLSDEDIAEFNPEKFENVEITIALPKALESHLLSTLTGGVADFNALDVTEIDFEDLKEAEEDGSKEV